MAMQYYALLQRRAATDAEPQKALQPVALFFAYRHPVLSKCRWSRRSSRAE
jgi:hypothetical protein